MLKLRKAATPTDEIVLSDEDGEVMRFGVVRKKVSGVICGGEQFESFIALPRLMWLERDVEP